MLAEGKMPVNNQINSNLQNILNMLPNLNVEALVRSLLVKTNDMHLGMYLAALVRSVIALHNLLNNKIQVGGGGVDSLMCSYVCIMCAYMYCMQHKEPSLLNVVFSLTEVWAS